MVLAQLAYLWEEWTMTKQTLRKTHLEPLLPEKRRTEAQLSAFGELVPGYREWYERNYDESGNVRREQEKEYERTTAN